MQKIKYILRNIKYILCKKSNSFYAKIKFILCKYQIHIKQNNKNICENQIHFMRK